MPGAPTGWSVEVAAPIEVVYDYLADPHNRPEWQSSLARVDVLDDGPPRPGMRWVDRTRVGIAPRMRITEMVRPTLWVEEGDWRGVHAVGRLHLEPRGAGCRVRVSAEVTGRGAWWPLGPLLTFGARYAVRGDLARAAGILAQDGRRGP